eukprot:gnl/TRDRNA2_/TRDRNA2_148577_c2_seq1.p1 gnl/TRDRNA2_/TRDRNA2_148577_c2~~gnl/TRDRNA2_/TRDRNA2_148577_c2_seq1.p1  ORF type:complete len:523 (+),score=97.24 gnl/TRDRNA2_/TRDRNA2_148577_c2_seq1:71-1570(+)
MAAHGLMFFIGNGNAMNMFDLTIVTLCFLLEVVESDIPVSIGRMVRPAMKFLRIGRAGLKLVTNVIKQAQNKYATRFFQPITINCVYLNGIMDHDTGILKYLVQSRHPELFESTLVKAVLEFKWFAFARSFHLFNLAVYVTHACFWVVYSIVAYNGWEEQANFDECRFFSCNMHKDVLGIITCGFSLRYLTIEMQKVYGQGVFGYFSGMWNVLSITSYTLLSFSTIAEFFERHAGKNASVASIATLLTWWQTLYYLRGFRGTGALVSMIMQIMKDMRYFILIMLIMTGAFIQVYFILATPIFPPDQPQELFWELYNAAWLGNMNEGYDGSALERFMYVAMTLFMILVLLNLLIAIMGDTFARVQESAIIEFYHNFAELIYELEMLMSESDRQNRKYFPHYMLYAEQGGGSSGSAAPGSDGGDAGGGVMHHAALMNQQHATSMKGVDGNLLRQQVSLEDLRQGIKETNQAAARVARALGVAAEDTVRPPHRRLGKDSVAM